MQYLVTGVNVAAGCDGQKIPVATRKRLPLRVLVSRAGFHPSPLSRLDYETVIKISFFPLTLRLELTLDAPPATGGRATLLASPGHPLRDPRGAVCLLNTSLERRQASWVGWNFCGKRDELITFSDTGCF